MISRLVVVSFFYTFILCPITATDPPSISEVTNVCDFEGNVEIDFNHNNLALDTLLVTIGEGANACHNPSDFIDVELQATTGKITTQVYNCGATDARDGGDDFSQYNSEIKVTLKTGFADGAVNIVLDEMEFTVKCEFSDTYQVVLDLGQLTVLGSDIDQSTNEAFRFSLEVYETSALQNPTSVPTVAGNPIFLKLVPSATFPVNELYYAPTRCYINADHGTSDEFDYTIFSDSDCILNHLALNVGYDETDNFWTISYLVFLLSNRVQSQYRLVCDISICSRATQNSICKNTAVNCLTRDDLFNVNQCLCDGGINVPDGDIRCVNHGDNNCISCNDGYYADQDCEASGCQCFANYCGCPNGTPVAAGDASCTNDGDTKCADCDAGYRPDGDNCVANSCNCDYGTAVSDGHERCVNNGDTICESCDGGYGFTMSDDTCTANQCYCTDGFNVPDGDARCTNDGDNVCASCEAGYIPDGNQCVAEQAAPVVASTEVLNPSGMNRWYSSVYGNSPTERSESSRSMLDSPQGWNSARNSVGEWMTIDLNSDRHVVGVKIQKNGRYDQHINSFKIRVWADGESADQVTDIENERIFEVNWIDPHWSVHDAEDIIFTVPVTARYVRIYPQSWRNHMTLRAGVIVGVDGCVKSCGDVECSASDWYNFGDEYYHMSDQKMFFDEAVEYCNNLGAHVWCPESEAEHDNVVDHFCPATGFCDVNGWLGIHQPDSSSPDYHGWVCNGEDWSLYYSFEDFFRTQPQGESDENHVCFGCFDYQGTPGWHDVGGDRDGRKATCRTNALANGC